VVILGLVMAGQSFANMARNSILMEQGGNAIIEDKGRITSCLGVANNTVMVEWTPRVIRMGETVVFNASLNLPDSFLHGKMCLNVYLDDIPDPIFSECSEQHCDQFVKFVQQYLPQLTCPLPKGVDVKRTLPFVVRPTMPLPAGKYFSKVEMWNENNIQVMCAEGKAEINDE